jgi:hypothetical protein
MEGRLTQRRSRHARVVATGRPQACGSEPGVRPRHRKRMRLFLILLLFGRVELESGTQGSAPVDLERADRATIRLAPSAFPELPRAVRRELERRGCVIPQAFSNGAPHNIVRGRFTSSGHNDWAVLCSRRQVSSILVFRNGSVASVLELARLRDRDRLQSVGPGGAVGFSRALGVADPKFIKEHHGWYGGPKPPPLDHDGINDMFLGKASVVWYRYAGRWLQLTGAD